MFVPISVPREVLTHLNIGWSSCIILSNLNIQKIPKIASPSNNTSSSNQ